MRQVIDAALAADCGDEWLKTASVTSVEPQVGGASLLVLVTAPVATMDDILAMESRLRGAAGLLRSAVAAELRRKRVPHLQFRVVPEIA